MVRRQSIGRRGRGGGTEKRKDKSGLRRGARSKQWKGIGREREKKEEEEKE